MKSVRSPRRWWRSIVVGVALLGTLVGWRQAERHALVAGWIPARPGLKSDAGALAGRLARSDREAQGYLRPVAGLASLSRLYHANGFYPEALQCYEGLRRAEPGQARWAHLAACILAEFGRLDEALPLERRAVDLQPDYLPARLRLGDILLKADRTAESIASYRAVLDRNPVNEYALLGLARCALGAGDWNQAREHLRQAVAGHPDFVGALSLLVTVDEHLGANDEIPALRAAIGNREFTDLADPWLEALVDDCYDPYRLSVAAAVAVAGGDLATGRRRLERAVELAPEAGAYHRQLATLLTRMGDPAGARAQLETAVTVTPDDADSWLLLVRNLNAAGDTAASGRVLGDGLAACPQSPSLHLEHARFFNRAGRPLDAIAEFRESYRLRPSEAAPLVELASVLFAHGRVDEAREALLEALRKQPDHPIALATLALIAIGQADEAAARGWWNRLRGVTDLPPPVAATVRQAFAQQFGRPLP